MSPSAETTERGRTALKNGPSFEYGFGEKICRKIWRSRVSALEETLAREIGVSLSEHDDCEPIACALVEILDVEIPDTMQAVRADMIDPDPSDVELIVRVLQHGESARESYLDALNALHEEA